MNNNLEFKRQLFHIFFGIAIVILLMLRLIDKWALLYLIIIGLIISFISRNVKIPFIYWFLENFERPEHLKKFPGRGVITYLIGAFLVNLFFSIQIAMPAIIILALGDSISHMFGVRFGKTRHPLTDRKFLEGSLAGFIAGFIGALIFVVWYEALFASLFAMIAEAIEIKLGREQVDDNIIMPLTAGIVILIIRLF